MQRIVIALGGNALGNTPREQLRLVRHTAEAMVDLARQGCDIMIGHGNGPQVGMINSSFNLSSKVDQSISEMPFPECGAMSQGYIGYQLQQAIQNELDRQHVDRKCVSVITQVVVDEQDPAFQNPTKPIGHFLDKATADSLALEKGFTFVEDAGRGFRRVVASPVPKQIVESRVIQQLVDQENIVITVGGGGIPVIHSENGYTGIPAVIDKDHSCAKLAIDLNADLLIILTVVEKVYIHFNQPKQTALDTVTVNELKQHIADQQFAAGSMLPKIEACIDFVETTGNKAIITSLEKAKEALSGTTGTIIVSN